MKFKLGPVGVGKLKDIEETFENYSKLGFSVAEIPFTYGVYVKKKEDALRIKKAAKKYKIELSIHAPYWINLNSLDWEKIEASKKRILDSCEVGELIGAKAVVFHAGFYNGREKEETYTNIKNRIVELQKVLKEKKWKIKLAPEVMGKINVFGSLREISNLAKDTGCSFCIDFAHVLARYKRVDIKRIKRLFPYKKWHLHFSGIEYGPKGEKKHIATTNLDWKEFFEKLPKNKKIKIICEAPDPVGDALKGLNIYNK